MIPLYIMDGAVYVWNSDDWYTLRTKHRICGSLIGSVPAFPRQNEYQGLPMELMAEEATLLEDIGVCELFEIPNLTEKLAKEEKEKIDILEKISLEEQAQALRKKRIEQLSQKIDIIFAGKKKKLVSKGATNVELNKEAILQEEINKLPDLTSANILVHLPTEHYTGTGATKVSLSHLNSDVPAKVMYVRYVVFKNLWEQGNYITNGSKFGADFLVYPGDPVKFHASYMIRCITYPETCLRPANLVAFGRLAVSVNKLAVLASCDSFGQVEYQTLQWHDSVN